MAAVDTSVGLGLLDSEVLQGPLPAPAPVTTPTAQRRPLDEYRQVDPLIKAPLTEGGSYYVLNRRWYVEWMQWVGHPEMQSPKLRPMADPCLTLEDGRSSLDERTAEPGLVVSGPRLEGSPDLPDLPCSSSACEMSPATSAAKRTRTHSWTKDRPGPIDNSELLEPNGGASLRKNVSENADFTIVPEDAWNLLYSWYGGGPTIKRRAIQTSSGSVQVELHGLQLKVYKSSTAQTADPVEVIESQYATVKELKTSLCRQLGVDYDKVRIWDYFNQRNYALLEKKLDQNLETCRIFNNNQILLEEQNADGTWPNPDPQEENTMDSMGDDIGGGGSLSNGIYSSYSNYVGRAGGDVPSVGQPIQVGAVGLQNLGNTCFMNSSLQCLSNIPPLRQYFLSEDYKRTLNRTAYRTQGKLAESFAALLNLMWREDTTRVAPRNFKWQVGQFAEQFSGYGQQDSMELIEYVLDGLKEDCNSVQGTKPYIEVKEADGRSDEEVAQEVLEACRARSDSYVENLFAGLFKSVVECPEAKCGRVSVTFDPFLSAKLSLVSSVEQRMTSFQVTIVWDSPPATGADRREPVDQVRIKVSKDQNVKALIEAAAKEAPGLDPSRCVLVEVWNKKVHKFFEDTEAIESIRADDFLLLCEVSDAKAFQLSTEQRWGSPTTSWTLTGSSYQAASTGEESPPGKGNNIGVIVHHRQVSRSAPMYWGNSSHKEIKGLPMLLSVPKTVTGRGLYELVERKIKDTIFAPSPEETEDPGWKLIRVEKYNPTGEGTLVEASSDQPLDLKDSKEYFAVEWPEDREMVKDAKRRQREQALLGLGENSSGMCRRIDQEQDLSQLLKLFTEREKLGEDDAWYCNKCKEHKEAYKKLEFHRLPPVLVLQLKRFQFTRWSRERLDNPIRFPLEGLDLAPFCTETSRAGENSDPAKTTYDLAGMSKHIGSLGGGHYVAYCRSSQDGEWYNYDDGSVRRVSKDEVEQDKVGAYVLFYIRRDYRPSNFGVPASP